MSESGTFPVPNDKLALIDIDGTLLDGRYQLTDEQIYKTVQETQEKGWLLGLSSDSSYESMSLWRTRLDLNGPLVAERGAVGEASGGVVYERAVGELFHGSRLLISDYFSSNGYLVQFCNPVEVLSHVNEKYPAEPGSRVILINDSRLCSLNFFVRIVDEQGKLIMKEAETEKAVTAIRQFYPELEDLAEDLNHDYGLLIISRAGDNKRSGTQALMEDLCIDKIAMIGNSSSDYLGADLALHYAVSNSTDQFKEQADYVAGRAFTAGVVEILGGLAAIEKGIVK